MAAKKQFKHKKKLTAVAFAILLAASSITAQGTQTMAYTASTDVVKKAGGWWVVRNRKIVFFYNGFAQNDYGWWYVRNGKVDFSVNDVVKGTVNGKDGWWLVRDGKVTFTDTAAKNANGWWVIQNGKVNFAYNGLASNANGTWKITNGKVTFADNGVIKVGNFWYNLVGSKVTPNTVAKNANGWWYIDSSGKVDFTANTVAKNANGWWVIQNGKVNFSYNGLASNANGTWKITNGKVTFKDTGVIKVGSDWYNLSGSKVVSGTTVAKNANGWWYIDSSGKVDFNYTGIARNKNGSWYIKNGKVDFSYSGAYNHNGTSYVIDGGKVIGELEASGLKFVAHRGLSAEAPENTVKSFTLAGEAGFWGCETDVYLTADQHFITLHDNTFSSMCGVNKTPGEMTLNEVKQLHIISGNNYSKYKNDITAVTIPTLEEYLAVCLKYNMVPVIEIKENIPDYERMQLLYETTESVIGNRQVVFISFYSDVLIQMRNVLNDHGDDQTILQHIVSSPDTNMIDTYKEWGMELDSSYKGLTAEDMKTFQANEIKVNLWTVDNVSKIYSYIQNGVDYITTNKCFWQ